MCGRSRCDYLKGSGAALEILKTETIISIFNEVPVFIPTKRSGLALGIVTHGLRTPPALSKTPERIFTREPGRWVFTLIHFLPLHGKRLHSHEWSKYFYFPARLKSPPASAFNPAARPGSSGNIRHIPGSLTSASVKEGLWSKYSPHCRGRCGITFQDPQDPSTFPFHKRQSNKGFNSLHTVSLGIDLLSREGIWMCHSTGQAQKRICRPLPDL